MPEPTSAALEPSIKRLPLSILIVGAVFTLGSALLAARIIWEMTFLTWQQGPQMVGFSLAHGSYAPLLLSPFLLAIWILVCGAVLLVWRMTHHRIDRSSSILLTASIAVLATLSIPQSAWNRLFIGHLAASTHRAEFLVYAAAEGDLGTVRALIGSGVNIESATASDHNTALHAAANAGQPKVALYLLDHGADPNSLDTLGNSPLHGAIEDHHADVADILRAHGAKDVSHADKERALKVEDKALYEAEHAHPQPRLQANQ